jgi:hypothetical protein
MTPKEGKCQFVQWIDEQALHCTVLLEKARGDSIAPHGTGFLIYNYAKKDNPIVVTCAHLLKGSEIYVSVTADSEFISYIQKNKPKGQNYALILGNCRWVLVEGKFRCSFELKENETFVTHPSLDIAAFPITLGSNAEIDGIRMQITKVQGIPKSLLVSSKEINLGDDIYFVGFPFTIGTKDITLHPLVRTGCIAWYSPNHNEFLLDALSYSGNSGGPVFLKRSIQGRSPNLLGMVIGHYGMTIENLGEVENFGLARCLWIDDIIDVIQQASDLSK